MNNGSHKYISELLGKSTIDTNTYGKSSGRNGNYSTNYQNSGRELLTPDEVRMLDNKYAILFIRGERPVKDLKFNLLEHKNIELSGLKGKIYIHGGTENETGEIIKSYNYGKIVEIVDVKTNDYALLDSEELERFLSESEEKR